MLCRTAYICSGLAVTNALEPWSSTRVLEFGSTCSRNSGSTSTSDVNKALERQNLSRNDGIPRYKLLSILFCRLRNTQKYFSNKYINSNKKASKSREDRASTTTQLFCSCSRKQIFNMLNIVSRAFARELESICSRTEVHLLVFRLCSRTLLFVWTGLKPPARKLVL